MSVQSEVLFLRNMFRNLNKWKILVDDSDKRADQCYWDVKKKIATIYRKTAEVDDLYYAYHELLHIVLMATFRGTSKYSRKKKEQLIEILVEDLTAFLFLMLEKKKKDNNI